MGKFNISTTKGGEIGDLAKIAKADLPIEQQVEEEVTQESPPTILQGIVEQSSLAESDPETAGIIEEGINAGISQEQALVEQKERERVDDIITRRDDPTRVDRYDYAGNIAKQKADMANKGPSSDGGLATRSKAMAAISDSDTFKITGLQYGQGPVKQVLDTTNAFNPEGKLDKGFLQMTSVITENLVANIMHGEAIGEDVQYSTGFDDEVAAPKDPKDTTPVPKSLHNAALGKQIHREWQRYRNKAQGLPTDQYTDLSNDQATVLGDLAKELYAEVNGPEFIKRGQTESGVRVFTLTKHGADMLKQGEAKRKRMFPKQHVRPSKTPLPGGQFVGEGRVYTKRVSSKVNKPLAGAEVISAAMNNLNKVENVVDKQRLKILFATAIPVLAGKVKPDSLFAEINHVGQDKYNEFAAKEKKDPDFVADEEYQGLIDSLAQNIYGISRERKGINYLTYYIQAFNGRIAPQQTHFDPTTSKSVRFVTRNGTPAVAQNGNRVEQNLRQMYAMMLLPKQTKADVKLPKQRDQLLEQGTDQLHGWGTRLKQVLDGITDAQVEAVAQAIEQGVPVTDPNFPQLPILSLDPAKDAALIKHIKSKGEDGQATIDGLIDFANYIDAKRAGKPHRSFFNAYMDGKTNGLASNGIQMGSENVASKTGVLRSNNALLLDNNVDIRDDLKNVLLEDVRDNGFDGTASKFGNSLPYIASKLYADRTLNKSTTMTFGYGMELGSFKKVIGNRLLELAEGDPDLREAIDNATGTDPEAEAELIDTLFKKYITGLEQALDSDALASRALMRSAAIYHALTNELFTLRSPTGFELNLGATELTSWEGDLAEYGFEKEGKKRKTKVAKIGEQTTAAAPKRRVEGEGIHLDYGGIAYGGSVPGPVQSVDAATVAMTSSGRSWNKLRSASNGKPYLHTIYDAFKVDAMGYDVVLDEVNKNWLDAGMNWSYLEEARNSMDSLRERFQEKTKHLTNNDPVPADLWTMTGYLLSPVKSKTSGKMYFGVLQNKLDKLLEKFGDPLIDDNLAYNATIAISKEMAKVGITPNKIPEKPTMGQMRTFLKVLSNELNLNERLNKMITKTNNKKANLKKRIKEEGNKVYQYYSH